MRFSTKIGLDQVRRTGKDQGSEFHLALRVERDVREFSPPACRLIRLSWPDSLIRKRMFLGIHVQTRQRLNEAVKTGIPTQSHEARAPRTYNPMAVRNYDETDELSSGHSPALYAARY